jgi:hypothetical protein
LPIGFPCSALFVNAEAQFGGDYLNCLWTNANTLTITLGGTALLQPAVVSTDTVVDPRLDPDCLSQLNFPAWQSRIALLPPRKSSAEYLPGSMAAYHVLDGRLSAEDLDSYFEATGSLAAVVASGSVDISRPLEPTLPMPILSGVQVVGQCAGIKLNTYATASSGGRDFASIRWTIDTETEGGERLGEAALQNITKALQVQDGQPAIEILAAVLPIQEYLVTVHMVNFMCFYGTDELQVGKRLAEPPMVLLASPATRTVVKSDAIRLEVDATLPSCGGGGGSAKTRLGFQWNQYEDVCNASSTGAACGPSANPKILLLPAYALNIGKHTFSIDTFVEGAVDLVTTTQFYVQVIPSEVIANIAGGARNVLLGQPFHLDASQSRNPNYLPGATNTLSYIWSCYVVRAVGTTAETIKPGQTTCADLDPVYATADDRAEQLVVPSIFSGFSDVQLRFSILVASIDNRNNNATADVLVSLEEGVINGTIVLEHLYTGSGKFVDPNRINPSDKLVLMTQIKLNTANASEYNTLGYQWSSRDSVLDLYRLQEKGLISPRITGQGVGLCDSDPSLYCNYLVFKAGIFQSGSTYNIQLDLTQGYSSARTDIRINVNSAPTGGQFLVDPVSGQALVTQFDFLAISWTDDPSDLPLSFAFAQQTCETCVVELLRPFNSQADATSGLPPGGDVNETLTAIAYVRDKPGAEEYVKTAVQSLAPAADEIGSVVNASLSIINALLEETNPVKALVAMSQSSSLLKPSNASATNATDTEKEVRGTLLMQAVQASGTVFVDQDGVFLQMTSVDSITNGGRVGNDTASLAMTHINNLMTGATDSGDPSILTGGAAQSAVGSLSNLVSVGVGNSSLSTMRDSLDKTAALQNKLLVSGEDPVETTTDNLVVAASRIDLSSASPIGLSGSGDAAGFGLPSQASNSSVGVAYVQFKQNPYAFAGNETNDGLASEVTSLDLTSSDGPVTQFPEGLSVALPVTDPAFADAENGAQEVIGIQQVNVTCLKNSTIPFNIANISWFDCPDEHGNQLYNLTCSGNETYFDDLTCNTVLVTVASCAFWDVEKEVWSDKGCSLNEQVNGSLSCTCTHLTDYVAQFSTIGANFLATLSFIAEISLEDLLAALPALAFFGTLCGIFIYAMIRSHKTYKDAEKERILEELNDPATAVLFQLALQEENVARFLIGQSTKSNGKNKLKSALVSYEEMFMAYCLSDGTASAAKAEQIRTLFNAIDVNGDEELSATELFKFFRFANPEISKEDITKMTGLVKFSNNATGVGVITCDEFVKFFSIITQNLDQKRFDMNISFWLTVKQTESKILKSVGLSDTSPDVLAKEAVGWAQETRLTLKDDAAPLPPPMFEPWREQETEQDTKELDEMLVAKALVEHNTQQLKDFTNVRGNFWKGMCINHPIVNLFSDFTDLHRHQVRTYE